MPITKLQAGRSIQRIHPVDPRRIYPNKISRRQNFATIPPGTCLLPCFRPVKPEDSLFLPRCGHAVRSHCALRAGKWGDCQMKIKASGRSALILATTGLFVCFAGPSQAASVDNTAASAKSEITAGAAVAPNKSAKSGSRHWKSHAHRKYGNVVAGEKHTSKTDATEFGDKD